MSLAMKIQLAIVGTVVVIGIVATVIGLIRVVPEINKICDDAKKAADDSRDQKGLMKIEKIYKNF